MTYFTWLAGLVALGAMGCSGSAVGTGEPSGGPATGSQEPPSPSDSSSSTDPSTPGNPPASKPPPAPSPKQPFTISVSGVAATPVRYTTSIVDGSTRKAELVFTTPLSPGEKTLTIFADRPGSTCASGASGNPSRGLWLTTFSSDPFGYVTPATNNCGLLIFSADGQHVAGYFADQLVGENPKTPPIAVTVDFDIPVKP